jgi:clan AA aspartic protease (TIGR02281 family)
VFIKGIATLALSVVLAMAAWTPATASKDPQFDRAVALFNAKQYSAAIPVLQKILSAPEVEPTPIYYAGLCYQHLGNQSMAQQCYQVLVDNYSTSPEANLARPALERMKSAVPPKGSTPTAAISASGGGLGMGNINSYLRGYTMSDKEWASMPDETKVPFKRATSSHLFVNGTVNGHSLQMMFDTGAEQCHFSRAELEQMGIRPEKNAPRIPVSGVGGTAYCTVLLADIGVGDLKRRIPVLVDDKDIGMPVIGETFFKEFRYSIDNGSGFLTFTKRPRDGMPTHTFESTDVIAIPYQSMGDNMVVKAKVNGRDFPMIFDTGSFSICFSLPQAQALGISIPSDARMLMTSGAGGAVPAYEFAIDRLELGPLIKTHVTVVVNRSDTPMLPLLGQPFYKDRRFTVDNEKHLIKFAH